MTDDIQIKEETLKTGRETLKTGRETIRLQQRILYATNPEYREMVKVRSREYHRKRYATDEAYRQKTKDRANKANKENKANNIKKKPPIKIDDVEVFLKRHTQTN